ncbi:MAG: hypothetical protein E7137_03215 [Rikenellaceae bacterium]|nr:hypothetical protein [Rikenellaceae bacterium]
MVLSFFVLLFQSSAIRDCPQARVGYNESHPLPIRVEKSKTDWGKAGIKKSCFSDFLLWFAISQIFPHPPMFRIGATKIRNKSQIAIRISQIFHFFYQFDRTKVREADFLPKGQRFDGMTSQKEKIFRNFV